VQESPSTDWVKSDGASISGQLERLQEKQRAAVERAKSRGKGARPHPDLEDLNLDDNLPAPIKPTTLGVEEDKGHGSLSDYSDYDSSADEAPRASSSTANANSSRYDYKSHRVNEADDYGGGDTHRNLLDDDDPFADPFADQSDVGTPGIPEKGQPKW
jgi:LAS seventeen-binding protein 5